MKECGISFPRVLTLLLCLALAFALLPTAAPAAHADGTGWSVACSNSGTTTTFTIRRTDTSKAETVRYRTVSLSAFEGQHFNAKNGTLKFAKGDDEKTVTITEKTPDDPVFRYQALVDWRTYRFEVTDTDGFTLASCDREMRTAIKVQTYAGSGRFDLKDEHTANLYGAGTAYAIKITDDGYDSNPAGQNYKVHRYLSVDSSAFYDEATQGYFAATGAQLRMTLKLKAREVNDGYQYIQVLTDNTSSCDNRKDCKNGDPGNISLSRYMAGFEIDTGSTYTNFKTFTFPVLSAGNNAGAANPWGHGTNFPLS